MALRLPASLAWPCAAIALGGAGHALAGPAAEPAVATGDLDVTAVRFVLDPDDPTRIAGVRLAVGTGVASLRVRLDRSSAWRDCAVQAGRAACRLEGTVAGAASLEVAAPDD